MINRMFKSIIIYLIAIIPLIGQVETYVHKQPKVIEVSNTQNDAFTLLDKGAYSQALRKFEVLLEGNPSLQSALIGKGKCLFELGRYNAAFEIFSWLHGAFPNNAYVLECMGDIEFHSSRLSQALAFYKKAQKIVPEKPSLYDSLTKTFLCLEDSEMASENSKLAILLNNKKGEVAPYSLILAYFAFAEDVDLIGQNSALKYIERLNLRKKNAWPYPILSFIKGTLKSTELLSYVESEEQEIQAHAYIGLKLRLEDQDGAARKHLDWVKQSNKIQLFETIYVNSIPLKPKV